MADGNGVSMGSGTSSPRSGTEPAAGHGRWGKLGRKGGLKREKEGVGWSGVEHEGDLRGDGFGSGGDPDVGEEWRRGGTSLLGFRVRLDLVGGGLLI